VIGSIEGERLGLRGLRMGGKGSGMHYYLGYTLLGGFRSLNVSLPLQPKIGEASLFDRGLAQFDFFSGCRLCIPIPAFFLGHALLS
jgi:hypothetical protein